MVAMADKVFSVYEDVKSNICDPNRRADFVAKGLVKIGAEKVLDEKSLQKVAALTTVAGLMEVKEIAAPYIVKARDAEGRKELYVDGKEYAAPYIQEGVEMFEAKIVNPTKEYAAPYIASLQSKRDAITSDKRFQKAVAGIQNIREHPREFAEELKAKAVDLLKYEDVASYRAYVSSAEFQQDTIRLVNEDLPTFAKNAAHKGYGKISENAMALATAIESKIPLLAGPVKKGVDWGRAVELRDLRAKALAFISELQEQILTGAKQVTAGEISGSELIVNIAKLFNIFPRADAGEFQQDTAFSSEGEVEVVEVDLKGAGEEIEHVKDTRQEQLAQGEEPQGAGEEIEHVKDTREEQPAQGEEPQQDDGEEDPDEFEDAHESVPSEVSTVESMSALEKANYF